MLLLTGILPKLKSDPVGDTSVFTSAQVAASGGHTHTSGPDLGPGLPWDHHSSGDHSRDVRRPQLGATVTAPTRERTMPPHSLQGRGATPNLTPTAKGHPPPGLTDSLKLIDRVVELAALPASLKDRLASGWLVTRRKQKQKGHGDSGPLALTPAEDEKMTKLSLVRGLSDDPPPSPKKTGKDASVTSDHESDGPPPPSMPHG